MIKTELFQVILSLTLFLGGTGGKIELKQENAQFPWV